MTGSGRYTRTLHTDCQSTVGAPGKAHVGYLCWQLPEPLVFTGYHGYQNEGSHIRALQTQVVSARHFLISTGLLT